jgi:membrane associated rhomboid family serine protease
MSSGQPEQPGQVVPETAETYCYLHPGTPTRLRCSRCERPICGRCAIPASVGQHCPECVAEARKSTPKVRTALGATAPAILAIIVATVAVFIGQQVIGGRVTAELASIPTCIAAGQWWRLITPVLVHGGVLHIGMNMLVLYFYGPNVEKAFGTARFVLMYLACAFVGSAFSFALGPNRPSVGASGAIFGIVGVLLVFLYNRRRSQFVAQYLRGILGFLILNLVLGFVIPNVDVLAHLGGLLAGVALGFGFDRQGGDAARSAPALQLLTTAAVVGTGVVLIVLKTTTFSGAGASFC